MLSRGMESFMAGRASLQAELRNQGLLHVGDRFRKDVGEYAVEVGVSEGIWLELCDCHVGHIKKIPLAYESLVSGWNWIDGPAQQSAASTASWILREIDQRLDQLERASFALFEDAAERQRYLVAKLVHVRDTQRFLELAKLISPKPTFAIPLVEGIAKLHGGEILRVFRNLQAAEEIVG